MATIYAKNKLTGEWERVGPAAAATDATLTLSGSPADAKVTGDAIRQVQDKIDGLTAADVGALPADTEIPSVEGLASEAYVNERITEVVGGAPELLNTLDELSAALNDDENFATTITNQIAEKQDKLTFDETPTEGSVNPVTSGGVKSYVDSAQVQADLSQSDENDKDYVKGVIRQESLPEGYPYKEVTVVSEPLNLTFGADWEENIDNPVTSNDGFFIKVSNLALTDEEIKDVTAVFTTTNGSEAAIHISEFWDTCVSNGLIKDDGCFIEPDGIPLVFVRGVNGADFTEETGIAFPEAGIYLPDSHYGYYSSLTTTKPIEQRTETIYPMSEEFLPYEYAQVSYVDEQLATKQNTITGTSGQYVGFDADGNAVAQNLTLTDTITGVKYQLCVTDGKLTLVLND